MKVVLTGGAGFVGSHVADHLLACDPDARIAILDKMTYAADFRNVADALTRPHTQLVVGDICDLETCQEVTKDVDLVIHLAAESHVDNSFGNSLHFTRTNVLGTHTLAEACRINRVPRILHVSTDEVYGDIMQGAFTESSPLAPTNPYSASKAGAEMVLRGYVSSFGLPVVMCRGNNIFGTRQYPEKIIPKFCLLLHRDQPMTVHGDGSNVRTYIAVQDFAEAVRLIATSGKLGEVYNVGTTEEYTNLDVASMLSERFGKPSANVRFVADRPFNDRRYSVDCTKIHALGWQPQRTLVGELEAIVSWYKANAGRYDAITT